MKIKYYLNDSLKIFGAFSPVAAFMLRAQNFAVSILKKNKGEAKSNNKEGDIGEKIMMKKSQRGWKKM